MKNITLRRVLSVICALITAACLSSCGYEDMIVTDTEEFYLTRDSEMDETTHAALEEISTYFEAFLADAQPEGIKPYLSADFGAEDSQLVQFAEYYRNIGANPFTVYDSYYIKGVKPDTVTRRFKKSADAKTAIDLTPGSSEMYAVLYASENPNISHMVTMLCAKAAGKWEIVWIDASDFKYLGKDAPALYAEGLSYAEDQNPAAAYVTALKLELIRTPGNALAYAEGAEMEDFCYKQSSDFSEAFPMPIDADGIKLHALALANEQGEIIPLIIMQTDTALDKSKALKKEAASIVDAIDEKSPGFSAAFPKIAVNAVNDDPTTTENPETASFVLE